MFAIFSASSRLKKSIPLSNLVCCLMWSWDDWHFTVWYAWCSYCAWAFYLRQRVSRARQWESDTLAMGSASFANPDSYSSLLMGCIHQPWCPNVLWASVVNSQLSGRSRTGVEQLIEFKSWFNHPGTCTYSPYTTIGNSNVQIQTLSSVAHVKIKAHQGRFCCWFVATAL